MSEPDLIGTEVPENDAPVDPEDVHADDVDPEDVEDSRPQDTPLPDDADERVVEPADEVPD